MSEVSDITENETWVVKSTMLERYDFDVELQIADSEIRLRPSDRTLTECPVFYWGGG